MSCRIDYGWTTIVGSENRVYFQGMGGDGCVAFEALGKRVGV